MDCETDSRADAGLFLAEVAVMRGLLEGFGDAVIVRLACGEAEQTQKPNSKP